MDGRGERKRRLPGTVGRNEEKKDGWKEGRIEIRKEGRIENRKEERMEGRKEGG
jgi:hypothetical protein